MTKYKLINRQTGEEHLCEKETFDEYDYYKCDSHLSEDKITIATNNPTIDIPKVVDEVEELANQKTLPHLRAVYIEAYNKSQESHPFSEEDMIEFLNWIRDNTVFDSAPKPYYRKTQTRMSQEELLQIWKEQKIKTVYCS